MKLDEFEQWWCVVEEEFHDIPQLKAAGSALTGACSAAWQAATERMKERMQEMINQLYYCEKARYAWKVLTEESEVRAEAAEAECKRLREAITDAPHDVMCKTHALTGGPWPCTCWKRDALKEG